MSFWDSSALLPLLIEEKTSPIIRNCFERHTDEGIVIWTLTPIEVLSAIHRLERMNQIGAKEAKESIDRFFNLKESLNFVRDVDAVKEKAERVLRLHPLKAADALQLASALAFSLDNPVTQKFITLDSNLAKAAAKEGFQVLPTF